MTTVMFTGLVPQAVAGPGEGSFVASMNAERAARGLAPLEVYWDLRDDARSQSVAMQAQDKLYHNGSLSSVTSGWIALGENVGVGPDFAAIQAAFMNSASHRKNILGDYNYLGVGTVQADGKMWVTVVFMKGPLGLVTPVEPEPAPETEPEPELPPSVQPVTKPTPSTPARRVSVAAPGDTGTHPVQRWGRPPGLHPYSV
ncbi:MAG: CAP domain-containing protein [Acidobacteria bacterium]|nr:CAP domain-containing protein [Acidobacteriota bacterium]